MSNGEEGSNTSRLEANSSIEYKFPERNYVLDEKFADFVKSKEGKYITKEEDYYIVSREIKGKREIFGKFTTYEFAREFERNLIINSWDVFFIPKVSRFGKYLSKRGKKFQIARTVKKEKRHYGTFNNLSDAIQRREELIENNWDFKKPFKVRARCDPNIYSYYNTFRISKKIDGQWSDFGTYDSYEDALLARDILIETNWDKTKIPEELISSYSFIKYRKFLKEWEIISVIDETLLSFGLFETRENAKKALDILMDNDWKISHVPLEYFADNYGIRTFNKKKEPYYSVVRRINDRVENLAFFDFKSDAIEFRNKLHFNNWEMNFEDIEEEEKYDEFIYQVEDKIVVRKEGVVYGEFDTIDDAVDFRLKCIKKNWNLDEK